MARRRRRLRGLHLAEDGWAAKSRGGCASFSPNSAYILERVLHGAEDGGFIEV